MVEPGVLLDFVIRISTAAGLGAVAADTTGLQVAVQRIGLDPKVTSSRWWPADVED